jgi:anti-sigma regulatory factor (Ser/Thr protein kinase)
VAATSQRPSAVAVSAAADSCVVLAAEYDWSESEFGPREQWAPVVETVVRAVLQATVPVVYCHGAGHAMVYNDRFADVLGGQHPHAWGQRVDAVAPQIWTRRGLVELIEAVFAVGASLSDDGVRLGPDGAAESHEQTYFVRRCSALRDSDGSVRGVVVVAAETASASVCVDGSACLHGPACVGGGARRDLRVPRWRGVELWDETVACPPLIWSGFHACAGLSEAEGAQTGQRFVAEGAGELILLIGGADEAGPRGHRGMERRVGDAGMMAVAAPPTRVAGRTAAGGDFYDGFSLPDGRLAVTIGDVKGCGVAAAAIMRQVRSGLRAATLTNSDPNAVFRELDELISDLDRSWPGASAGDAGFGGDLAVTALLAIFDPSTGALLLSSAGHFPPAVVRHPNGPNTQADPRPVAEFAKIEPGPPLGIPGHRPVLRLALVEGDALVAFTGGLLDPHERVPAQGLATLLGTLETMAATAPRSISQHVVDALIGSHAPEQDCALLVVVRDSRVHRAASVLVQPRASAVRGVRRWVRCQLTSWGLGEEIAAAAVMGVSELVSNVVLYAGTPARVSMELADRLLVMVEDTGTRGTPQRHSGEDQSALRGRGLALVGALADAIGHARGLCGSTVWFEMMLNGSVPEGVGPALESSTPARP